MKQRKLNLQQIFDKVATHLLQQDAKSLKDGKCCYRGDSGRKCAVGCLIDDEYYIPEIEGFISCSLVVSEALILSGVGCDVDAEIPQMLRGLQNLHDREPTDWWSAGLRATAGRYGLQCDHIPGLKGN